MQYAYFDVNVMHADIHVNTPGRRIHLINYLDFSFIISPESSVTLCFQADVSAATATMAFASQVKTVYNWIEF